MAELLLMIALASCAMTIAPNDERANLLWGGLAALGIAIFVLGSE
jgi:hypothetical protein